MPKLASCLPLCRCAGTGGTNTRVSELMCAFLAQGEEDKVVPPNQAVDMYDALKAKGLSTALVLFPGEQHGFRQVLSYEYLHINFALQQQQFNLTTGRSHADGIDGGYIRCWADVNAHHAGNACAADRMLTCLTPHLMPNL